MHFCVCQHKTSKRACVPYLSFSLNHVLGYRSFLGCFLIIIEILHIMFLTTFARLAILNPRYILISLTSILKFALFPYFWHLRMDCPQETEINMIFYYKMSIFLLFKLYFRSVKVYKYFLKNSPLLEIFSGKLIECSIGAAGSALVS